MDYTINKESGRQDEMIVYKLVDSKGNSYTIKGICLKDYENDYSSERRKMANALFMLRKTGFLACELSGRQKLPPLEYFQELKNEGLKLYAITYDDLEIVGKKNRPFDIYGLSTHSSHYLGYFFYRFYDTEYYKQVLSVLLPLIVESGIKCKQKSFIIFGDSRRQ